MWQDFWINVAADFASLIIGLIIAWLYFFFSKRTRLLRFFGISKSKRIAIYLSNLRIIPGGMNPNAGAIGTASYIPPASRPLPTASGIVNMRYPLESTFGGAIGIDGELRSYKGSAVVLNEVLAANRFRDVFNVLIPSISDSQGLISKILISDVRVQIITSPLAYDELESSTSFITLGSPGYNIASGYLEESLNSQTKFGPDNGTLELIGVPPINDLTQGFIERIYDENRQTHYFYVAGISELGTIGAAYFLATEWRRLQKKHKDNSPFVIMLRFDQSDFKKWSIVFER